MGQPSIQSGVTLWAVLQQCFSTFSSILGLNDRRQILADSANQKRVLAAIFDSDSRAFVTEDALFMLDHIDEHAKATLLAQAVAGLVMVLRRLCSAELELAPGVLSRELRLFTESEERREMLAAIEHSPVLLSCYMKSEIADLMISAITDKHQASLPLTTIGEERLSDGISWVSYRPCRDMGMPFGFTILALN